MRLPYPIALNRMYRNFRGVMVLSKEGKLWKQYAANEARLCGIKLLDGPVSVHIILHPKTKKDGTASKTRMDLDGCLKITLDSLNKIAYNDDKQIERLFIELGEAVLGGGLTVTIDRLREENER